ncbi:MAG: DNA polymerase III subunit delta [Clostridium sp.]|nr:DNA polymerase III subunit delta [Clostridium sp.]
MGISKLKQDIKSKKLNSLYLFYGDEDYLIRFYLKNIESILLKDDIMGLNKVVMEGNVEITKIIEACETMPVFSEKKLIILKRTGLFKSRGAHAKSKSKNDELIDYLQGLPSHVCLIFYEDSIDKRLKISSTVKKNGLIVEFPHQNQRELVRWAAKVMGFNKKAADVDVITYLIEICEPGMTDIYNEIEKIILFVGDKPQITIEDIKKVCTRSIKSRIFDLTDAIAVRDVGGALKLLDDMIILKEPLPKVLFMIARQLRQLLDIKFLQKDGFSPREIFSKIGMSPYIGNKIMKQADCFTLENLKNAIQESLEFDVSIKTGKIKDRAALELLICNLARG